VVPHDGIGVQFPSRLRTGLKQTLLKRLCRTGRFKDIAPVIAAIYHMIDRAFKLNPWFACHG
jgi:hypothetical protein